MSNSSREENTPELTATRTLRVDLADLLRGAQEAIIVHNGEDYRLRLTARGKLILTK
ncbi:MAG: hemin uptake protein HemP [Pseudomonadota bacterium]